MIKGSLRLSSQWLLGALLSAIFLLGVIASIEANCGNCPPPLVLFDDSLGNGISLQGNTNRALCQIVNDNNAPQGSKVLSFSTNSWLSNGDYCALFFQQDRDITGYTEIEFWLKSNHDNQYVTPSMKTTNNLRGFGLSPVGTQWKRYRFPLPQSFNGLDLHHVVSAFLLQLQLNAGDEIRVDYIRLLCRDYFPILADDTEPGREQLEPGGDQCQIQSDSYQHNFLKVSPYAWSCYMFFRDPSLNLNGFKAIQFWLKSYQDVLIIIQSNNRYQVQVPSTGGKWKQIRIPLSAFGNPDLSNVIVPFSIQRAQSNVGQPNQILVSDIRYLQNCYDPLALYCNDFEQRVGGEWSSKWVSTTPVGNRHFLGPFESQNVTFSLKNLPSHQYLKVEFDLFVIASWDGVNPTDGPDVWSMVVNKGPVLLRTTFSNHKITDTAFYQNYPDSYPGQTHPPTTGAIEKGTLGYPNVGYDGYGDSVYHISIIFPHSSSNLKLYFGSEPRSYLDELWGIDNFCVSIIIPS